MTAQAAKQFVEQLDDNLSSPNYKLLITQELSYSDYYIDPDKHEIVDTFFYTVEEDINVEVVAKTGNYYVQDASGYEKSENIFFPTPGCHVSEYTGTKSCSIHQKIRLSLYLDNPNTNEFSFSVMRSEFNGNYSHFWHRSYDVTLKAESETITALFDQFAKERTKYEKEIRLKNIAKVAKLASILLGAIVILFFITKILWTLKRKTPGYVKKLQSQKDAIIRNRELNKIKRISEHEMIKEIARNEVNNSKFDELQEMRSLIANAIKKGDTQTAQALSAILDKMITTNKPKDS